MEIRTKLREGARLPERQHATDAGADLCASLGEHGTCWIAPGSSSRIDTGVHVEIPPGYVGLVCARSSVRMRGLEIHGVIDSDYRGPLTLAVTNASDSMAVIRDGERVAQLIVHPIALPAFVQVDELSDTARGDGGFGSTGTGVRATSNGG